MNRGTGEIPSTLFPRTRPSMHTCLFSPSSFVKYTHARSCVHVNHDGARLCQVVSHCSAAGIPATYANHGGAAYKESHLHATVNRILQITWMSMRKLPRVVPEAQPHFSSIRPAAGTPSFSSVSSTDLLESHSSLVVHFGTLLFRLMSIVRRSCNM